MRSEGAMVRGATVQSDGAKVRGPVDFRTAHSRTAPSHLRTPPLRTVRDSSLFDLLICEFTGLHGLGVQFVDGGLFVKHVSGNYPLARK